MLAAGTESPFTWGIPADLAAISYEQTDLPVKAKEQPALAIMNKVMSIFCEMARNDYDEAKKKVAELEQVRRECDLSDLLRGRISLKVLEHVIYSTIAHFHATTGDTDTAESIIAEKIPAVGVHRLDDDAKAKDLQCTIEATIHGCRAMAYSFFDGSGNKEALEHAKNAIKSDQNCALWYFLKYQALRRERRLKDTGEKPSEEEKLALVDSKNLSDDPFYKIYKAEMTREQWNKVKDASEMYQDICKYHWNNSDILMRAAKELLKCGWWKSAKVCLNRVEWLDLQLQRPNTVNAMWLHYRGVYQRVRGDFEGAATWFKGAAECGVLMSDVDFIACQLESNRYFDVARHLEALLDKYTHQDDQQTIVILLGMCHHHKTHDYARAARRFLEGMRMNLKHPQLKNFRTALALKHPYFTTVNMFAYLRDFAKEYRKRENPDAEMIAILEDLRGCYSFNKES